MVPAASSALPTPAPEGRLFPYVPSGPPKGPVGGPDSWRFLRPIVREAFDDDPARMFMIRFDGLRAHAGNEPELDIHRLVEDEAARHLSRDDLLVRYDDDGYLLVRAARPSPVEPDTLGKRLSDRLFGLTQGRAVFETWAVVAVDDGGLVCRAKTAGLPVPVPLPLGGEPGGEPLSEGAGTPFVLGDAEFHFYPIWDVCSRMVLAYQCLPLWGGGGGPVLDETELEERFEGPRIALGLDLETLHAASRWLEGLIDRDSLGSLMIPVHFDTLDHPPTAERYRKAFAASFGRWSSRIFLEIVHRPAATPAGTTADRLTGLVLPRSKGIFLRRGWGAGELTSPLPSRVLGVGLDLYHEARPEGDVLADMEDFVGSVHASGVRAYVLGLRSVSLSVGAVCAGFDFVGSREMAAVLEPWGMDNHLVGPSDLYRALLAKAPQSY